MSSSSESIAQGLHGELDALIRSVSQVEGAQPSVQETEEQLWKGIRALGRGVLQLRFEACREAEVVQDQIEVNGTQYEYERTSQRRYVSLFGEVQVKRAYYLKAEMGGWCPLDGRLSLPTRSYSDSGQERLSEVRVWVPQDHSLAMVERWLGLKIAKGSLPSSASDQAL